MNYLLSISTASTCFDFLNSSLFRLILQTISSFSDHGQTPELKIADQSLFEFFSRYLSDLAPLLVQPTSFELEKSILSNNLPKCRTFFNQLFLCNRFGIFVRSSERRIQTIQLILSQLLSSIDSAPPEILCREIVRCLLASVIIFPTLDSPNISIYNRITELIHKFLVISPSSFFSKQSLHILSNIYSSTNICSSPAFDIFASEPIKASSLFPVISMIGNCLSERSSAQLCRLAQLGEPYLSYIIRSDYERLTSLPLGSMKLPSLIFLDETPKFVSGPPQSIHELACLLSSVSQLDDISQLFVSHLPFIISSLSNVICTSTPFEIDIYPAICGAAVIRKVLGLSVLANRYAPIDLIAIAFSYCDILFNSPIFHSRSNSRLRSLVRSSVSSIARLLSMTPRTAVPFFIFHRTVPSYAFAMSEVLSFGIDERFVRGNIRPLSIHFFNIVKFPSAVTIQIAAKFLVSVSKYLVGSASHLKALFSIPADLCLEAFAKPQNRMRQYSFDLMCACMKEPLFKAYTVTSSPKEFWNLVLDLLRPSSIRSQPQVGVEIIEFLSMALDFERSPTPLMKVEDRVGFDTLNFRITSDILLRIAELLDVSQPPGFEACLASLLMSLISFQPLAAFSKPKIRPSLLSKEPLQKVAEAFSKVDQNMADILPELQILFSKRMEHSDVFCSVLSKWIEFNGSRVAGG